MFTLSEALNFSALPVAGGLYDQHPVLLEQWRYILAKKAEEQQRKDEERERKTKAKAPPVKGASRPRR